MDDNTENKQPYEGRRTRRSGGLDQREFQPAAESLVQGHLSELGAQIGYLEQKINDVVRRIDPILRPEEEESDSRALVNPRRTQSVLSHTLTDLRERVEAMNHRLGTIEDLIEL